MYDKSPDNQAKSAYPHPNATAPDYRSQGSAIGSQNAAICAGNLSSSTVPANATNAMISELEQILAILRDCKDCQVDMINSLLGPRDNKESCNPTPPAPPGALYQVEERLGWLRQVALMVRDNAQHLRRIG